MAHKITLTIKTDGTVSSLVEGVPGSQCTTLSQWVNQLGEVKEDKPTDDFYRDDDQGVTVGGAT